jgi:hypothetical protein
MAIAEPITAPTVPAATGTEPGGTNRRATRSVAERVDHLSAVSARRLIEPEEAFDFSTLSPGRVFADELSSVAGLDLDLTEEQRAQLTREELASMLAAGIRFEAVLNATFSMELAKSTELADPRHHYMLHEVGEETRHQRAFLRLVEQLQPAAKNPLDRGLGQWVRGRIVKSVMRYPALFCVLLLAGEEIPDLLQKLASEHPETDPLLRAVNRYHRQEEARHLAFARLVLPERWAKATRGERFRVRHVAPHMVKLLFDGMVHPGVYRTVGLPAFATWRAAHRTPQRLALRHDATRPILRTLIDVGAFRAGHVPKAWRELCGVDRHGTPVTAGS